MEFAPYLRFVSSQKTPPTRHSLLASFPPLSTRELLSAYWKNRSGFFLSRRVFPLTLLRGSLFTKREVRFSFPFSSIPQIEIPRVFNSNYPLPQKGGVGCPFFSREDFKPLPPFHAFTRRLAKELNSFPRVTPEINPPFCQDALPNVSSPLSFVKEGALCLRGFSLFPSPPPIH